MRSKPAAKSLKTRISLFFLFGIVLSTLVSTVLSAYIATRAFRDRSIEIVERSLEATLKDVSHLVNRLATIVGNYAQEVSSSFVGAEDNESLEMMLRFEVVNAHAKFSEEGFSEAFVISKDGRVYKRDESELKELPEDLINIARNATDKLEIYAPVVLAGKLHVAILAPFGASDGSWRGMIGALYPLDAFQKIVESVKFGKTGYPVLTYKTLVIAHPKVEYVGKLDLVEESGTKPLGQAILSKDQGFVSYEFNGKKLSSFRRVGEYPLTLISIILEKEIEEAGRTIVQLGVLVGILVAIGGFLLSNFLLSSTLRKIRELGKVAKTVAMKDLTVSPNGLKHGEDEIADLAEAFEMLVSNLKQSMGEIMRIGSQVSVVSFNLSDLSDRSALIAQQANESVRQTSLEVQNIAAAAEEAYSGMEEISAGAQNVAQYATKLSEGAELMKREMSRVSERMTVIEESINSVKDAMEGARRSIEELVELSNQIGTIVETISSIADQTNLLALNAAIEAARAGEAGRGFAVVADEIRKLAEESRRSAERIAAILSRVVNQIRNVEGVTSSTAKTVAEYVTDVREAASGLRQLMEEVDAIAKMTVDLAAVSEEQSGATQEVTAAIERVTRSIQEIERRVVEISSEFSEHARELNEVSNSSKELSSIVEELDSYVKQFKL